MIRGNTSTKNDEWVSDNEVPDPAPLPRVLGWRLLVRPLHVRTKTKGGILLADTTMHDMNLLSTVGRVLAMGPLCFTNQDFWIDGQARPEEYCKVGDFISYGRYSGVKYSYKGVKLLLLNDSEVQLVVGNPNDLDPSYGFTQ